MSSSHYVLLLVFPEFQLLDATGPAEVFAAVTGHLPKQLGVPYVLRSISANGGLVRSSMGLELMTEALPEPASLAGCTSLVAGGFGVQQAMGQR